MTSKAYVPILTAEEVAKRRSNIKSAERVMFSVKALYGLSAKGMRMPLNENEFIESGQVCVTIDPDADPTGNVGIIDYEQGKLKVRYAAQMVFPGLYDLITKGNHDPSLLNPVRVVATDDCELTKDLSGWRALGCLEFLPGSIWAGAAGG
jgi:hypothetical protein